GVDDHRPEALGPKDLERLASGVVELARLSDDDRPGADQADRAQVKPLRQAGSPRPTIRSGARRREGRALPQGGTEAIGRARRKDPPPSRRRARRASPP